MVGTPRDEILVAAGDSDVVVVGSHAGGILDRQFIGSTTLHLLRGLGCDVLVVPARVAEAEGPDRPRPREEP
jgi:nucleotide-binding universal stress UspA family protein